LLRWGLARALPRQVVCAGNGSPATERGGTPCEESLFVSWPSLLCWLGLLSLVPAWLPLIRSVR
jgi:hypothetical protein